MSERWRRIKSIIRHKRSFAQTEKRLLGKNTFRAITHDLDKLLMLIFLPVSVKWIREHHKRTARHHNAKTHKDLVESMIDYECARFTKRNSTMTAREYVNLKYAKDEINRNIRLAILDELGLFE